MWIKCIHLKKYHRRFTEHAFNVFEDAIQYQNARMDISTSILKRIYESNKILIDQNNDLKEQVTDLKRSATE